MTEYREFVSCDYGTVSITQLVMMIGIASGQHRIGTHILEFGTLAGGTTTNLARMLPHHHVITVSLPPDTDHSLVGDQSDLVFSGVTPKFGPDVAHRITHLRLDSANLVLGPEIALGFVFIDGCHSEAYVLNDFAKAEPNVVPGGLVMFHDYGIDGKSGITGVKNAVDSIMTTHPSWDWMHWKDHGLLWGRKP